MTETDAVVKPHALTPALLFPSLVLSAWLLGFFRVSVSVVGFSVVLCRSPGTQNTCLAQSEVSKSNYWGQAGWLSGLAPPAAQGLILESRDRGPHRAPCMEPASPLPGSLPLSLSVSLMNK